MPDECLKEYLIDCVLNDENSNELMDGINRLFEQNSQLKQTVQNKNLSIEMLGEQKLGRDKEIKRLKEALTVAYAHCLEDEMDETIDMILHVLCGGKVESHWGDDLEKGKTAIKELR